MLTSTKPSPIIVWTNKPVVWTVEYVKFGDTLYYEIKYIKLRLVTE